MVRRLGAAVAWVALVGLCALPAQSADPTPAPVLAGQGLKAFCADLSGLIAAEAERERDDFAASLVEAVAVARQGLDKRVSLAAARADEDEGAPLLEWQADDALAAGRFLWERWMPTSPAAGLTVVDDRPDAWLLAPAPSPEAPYAGEPVRVDKHTGTVTWKLPHPSERERLHDALCGGGAPTVPATTAPPAS